MTPLKAIYDVHDTFDIFIKDESFNPTRTFKDRLAQRAVDRCTEPTLFASISYGNTAISFAEKCSKSHLAAFLAFVPKGFDNWQFGPSSRGTSIRGIQIRRLLEIYGAEVVEIDLSAKFYADEDLHEIARRSGILGDRKFVNVTEGIDEQAYAPIAEEAILQIGGIPDICVVQYGAGILCNEVIDVFNRNSMRTLIYPISTPDPQSIARMLYGPIWVDCQHLALHRYAKNGHSNPDRTGRSRDPYLVYAVSEEQIMLGLEMARSHGLDAEPSGVAGLGFLDSESIARHERERSRPSVLLINTGNGIDYVAEKL